MGPVARAGARAAAAWTVVFAVLHTVQVVAVRQRRPDGRSWLAAPTSADAWAEYRKRFVDVDDAAYVEAVGGRARLAAIPQAVF